MSHSVSTMSGKTKIKIVLLGNQSVGKSSIIEKYVKDQFDESSNVTPPSRSLPLASISSSRMSATRPRATDSSSGIQPARRDSAPSFPTISRMPAAPSSSSTSPTEPPSTALRCGSRSTTITGRWRASPSWLATKLISSIEKSLLRKSK